jgi:hypothetical protein
MTLKIMRILVEVFSRGEGNISTQNHLSPLENTKSRAQNTESGGSGRDGDIIPILP